MRMRVGVVAGFPPDPFGEAHYAGEVYRSLAKQFPEVELVVYAHKHCQIPDSSHILPNLRVERITQPENRLRASMAIPFLLYRILRFRPDLVHFQGTHTHRYGGISGEPITLVLHLLRLLKIPSVMTVHSTWMPSDIDDLCKQKGLSKLFTLLLKWYHYVNIWVMARALSAIDILSAGDDSPIVQQYQQAWHLPDNVVHIEPHPCAYSPVTPAQQSVAKKKLELDSYRIVLAIGFIRPDKGYHLLLDCAEELLRRFPDLVIIIAGRPERGDDIAYCRVLESKKTQLSAGDRIILKFEYLPEEELSTFVNAADIVVLPYLRAVGASGPLHRVLGAGKPVIASAIGHNLGLKDYCILVSPNNAKQLGEAVMQLLEDPHKRDLYKQRALEYASQHTWEALAKRYMLQYQQLCARR